MNGHVKFEHESIVKISSKGFVTLSKALLEKSGIGLGETVGVSANENGDLIIRKIDKDAESSADAA